MTDRKQPDPRPERRESPTPVRERKEQWPDDRQGTVIPSDRLEPPEPWPGRPSRDEGDQKSR
jgi:hypothetical protein